MSKNVLFKNAIANIISKVWSITSVYLFVPLWISFIGIEGYGIISFYTVLVSILAFADAGLSATLTREFAKSNISNDYQKNLLRTLEIIYVIIGIFLFVLIYICSPFIVREFLKTENISMPSLILYVRIMGGILIMNMFFMLYSGGLMGLQKQVYCNFLTILYGVSRSGLVLIILYFSSNVLSFLIWQLISIAVVVFLARYKLYNYLNSKIHPRFKLKYLENVWRYSIALMFMAIIGSINTQLDKLIISNALSVKYLGYYSLASTIGQAVTLLVVPIGQAVYPELTRVISLGDKNSLNRYFLFYSYTISMITAIIGFTLFFYNNDFILIWTGNKEIVDVISSSSKILILANIFLALQYMPYYLALSYGHTKTNVLLGGCMLFLTIPLTYMLTQKYGINGAAIPFLLLNVFAFFALSCVVFRKFVMDIFMDIVQNIIYPLLIGFIIILLGYLFSFNIDNSFYRIIYSSFVALISLYILFGLLLFKNGILINNSAFLKLISQLYPKFKKKNIIK